MNPRRTVLAAILVSLAACQTTTRPAEVEGYILSPEEGTKALSHLIKVEPARGASRLGLGTQRLRAGRGIALHIHDGEDEVLYVVSGSGVGVVGRVEREVVAGSLLYVPRGAWHGVRASDDMEILWVVSPPKFASYLREWQDAGGLSISEARWKEIAEKHQYADAAEFLRRVLARTRWIDPISQTGITFDDSGMRAHVHHAAERGELAIEDESGADTGFIATLRQSPSATPERVVLTYEFSTGDSIRLRWLDVQRSMTLQRSE